MSARLVIDGLDFIRNAGVHHGKIAVAEMERLQDYLFDKLGELEYSVSGTLGRNGRPVLRLAIKGAISLRCQRCLGGLAHAVNLKADLLLAENEGELARFDQDESVDAIQATPEMDVLALIEDEIILSLPVSPRHVQGECATVRPTGSDTGKEHAFAALAALKKQH